MNSFFSAFHWTHLLIIPGLLIGYTVHELGHALMAYFLGDYSQVERGKISLNPFQHISWFGIIAFLLIGIGWSKPLRSNPYNFKRKYLDVFFVALSGPLANLTLGLVGLLLTLVIAAVLVQLSGAPTEGVLQYLFPAGFPFLFPMMLELPERINLQAWSITFTGYIAATSFWLTIISLLPLPGQDGFVALISLVTFLRERRLEPEAAAQLQPTPMVADRPITLLSQRQRRNNAADIHFKVGAEFHEAHQYDDAIARYRQAISHDQYFGPAYINMGLAYLVKGDRKKAIQAFRGALHYADDQRSETEAWHQLHQLSEVSPINDSAAQEMMAEMGAAPWTDTKPRPNWLGLGIVGLLFLSSGILLYSYLFTHLVELLKIS